MCIQNKHAFLKCMMGDENIIFAQKCAIKLPLSAIFKKINIESVKLLLKK